MFSLLRRHPNTVLSAEEAEREDWKLILYCVKLLSCCVEPGGPPQRGATLLPVTLSSVACLPGADSGRSPGGGA